MMIRRRVGFPGTSGVLSDMVDQSFFFALTGQSGWVSVKCVMVRSMISV